MSKFTRFLKPSITALSHQQSSPAASVRSERSVTIPDTLAAFDRLPDSAYVRLPTVVPLFGASPATVWRWVKAGRLPTPVKLGPNVTAWRVGDLRRAMTQAGEASVAIPSNRAKV